MNKVERIFKNLFSQNEFEKGFVEEEIIKAEGRIGVKLPDDFRWFYLNQVRNRLINSCHSFVPPKYLKITNSKWLTFYGENQGIWSCALNIEEFGSKNIKVYVDYEQTGFMEESKDFGDFLIVKAACDYGAYIYPHSMFADNVKKEDVDLFLQHLDSPNSDINPTGYYHRKVFWREENEVIRCLEFDGNIRGGKKSIFIQSKNVDCFIRYKTFNTNIKWTINSKDSPKKLGRFHQSYLEKTDESSLFLNEYFNNNDIVVFVTTSDMELS